MSRRPRLRSCVFSVYLRPGGPRAGTPPQMGFGHALAAPNELPEHWYTSDEARGLHEAERLVCLLAQDCHAGPRLRVLHFVSALHAYNRACTLVPLHIPAYQCMAAFWRGVGRVDMRRRLLTTADDSPLADCENLDMLRTNLKRIPHSVPPFSAGALVYESSFSSSGSDYGADVLFDGLRKLLGADNVVGFPWKPTLHGMSSELAFSYPCVFNWPDRPAPLAKLERELAEGHFDAIIHCDAHGTLPARETRRILDAAGDTPVFLLDTWD